MAEWNDGYVWWLEEQHSKNTERIAALEGALRWYSEHAEALARYMTAKPPTIDAIDACVTALSLDAGSRAKRLLASDNWEG